ncbi:hypothetical protein EQG64_26730 [Streptomyces sp. S6]|nr:hypothetical protein EQG64_26730 [Streptomyces sp. S6]
MMEQDEALQLAVEFLARSQREDEPPLAIDTGLVRESNGLLTRLRLPRNHRYGTTLQACCRRPVLGRWSQLTVHVRQFGVSAVWTDPLCTGVRARLRSPSSHRFTRQATTWADRNGRSPRTVGSGRSVRRPPPALAVRAEGRGGGASVGCYRARPVRTRTRS